MHATQDAVLFFTFFRWDVFVGGFADDFGTTKTIRDIYDRTDHLIDTHTAVGFNVYGRYAQRSGDSACVIFVSTASPFKFGAAVSDALFGNGYSRGRSEEVLLNELSGESGLEIPAPLKDLGLRDVLHTKTIERDQMKQAVLEILS